jgi:hypothetical protein
VADEVMVAPLGDLADETVTSGSGLPISLRSRRDYLDKIVSPFRDQIHASVDANTQATARQLVDAAPLTR